MITFKDLKVNLKKATSNLPVLKVALMGDSATQFLSTAVKGMAVERGYSLNLFEAEYNQVERQILDPSSELYLHEPKYTIVFQSTHKLLEKHSRLTLEEKKQMATSRLSFVKSLCDSVPGNIIYFNYPEIDDEVFGSYSNRMEESFIFQLRKLNYELMNLSRKRANLFICDIASLQNEFGRKWMFDSSVYINTEMLLSLNALPYVASRTLDIICAVEGKFKKCLILDLDNTLWGGVVGDDGWENIQIGHGLGIGKAFTEFQEWIKKLKERGIIICVCSKNDEDKAKEPFVKNSEMVLKLNDISVFVANWDNKADNIRKIQSILNIGFDSMVFLDDNPAERAIVRENVSGVNVPELPPEPENYLEFLYSLNLFETASYSGEDTNRTTQYQIEARRVAAARSFTNESDFLKSLEMVSTVSDFNSFNTPRVAQLSQRSNQFNLRTVRYTEEQIAAVQSDPNKKGFAFTLEDKFGDNGLISVVILTALNQETVFIDTWFMSCRVLKRGMENFVLNTIADWAKAKGFKTMIGEYLPTQKNGMVADHYLSLGFTEVADTPVAQWKLELGDFQDKECYIKAK